MPNECYEQISNIVSICNALEAAGQEYQATGRKCHLREQVRPVCGWLAV